MNYYKSIKSRRTIYGIGNEKIVTAKKIIKKVDFCITYAPSVFNSQSARIVVLFNAQHERLWDIVEETLRKIIPEDDFLKTKEKIYTFKKGYGSILFFEDTNEIESFKQNYPTYETYFENWSQQGNAMLQYSIWTALVSEGLGASLQHYNPLIDEDVKKEWSLPNSWQLISQMPFGNPTAPAEEKCTISVERRMQVFGND